jgi:hypothetical protein
MQKLFKNLRADSVPDLFVLQNDKVKTAHYNYNVQEQQDEEGETYYTHDTLVVPWPLTRRNVFKTLLEALYPLDFEIKLINDYNTEMSIVPEQRDQSKIQAYQQFLSDRETLRQQVINDCQTANIPEQL